LCEAMSFAFERKEMTTIWKILGIEQEPAFLNIERRMAYIEY